MDPPPLDLKHLSRAPARSSWHNTSPERQREEEECAREQAATGAFNCSRDQRRGVVRDDLPASDNFSARGKERGSNSSFAAAANAMAMPSHDYPTHSEAYGISTGNGGSRHWVLPRTRAELEEKAHYQCPMSPLGRSHMGPTMGSTESLNSPLFHISSLQSLSPRPSHTSSHSSPRSSRASPCVTPRASASAASAQEFSLDSFHGSPDVTRVKDCTATHGDSDSSSVPFNVASQRPDEPLPSPRPSFAEWQPSHARELPFSAAEPKHAAARYPVAPIYAPASLGCAHSPVLVARGRTPLSAAPGPASAPSSPVHPWREKRHGKGDLDNSAMAAVARWLVAAAASGWAGDSVSLSDVEVVAGAIKAGAAGKAVAMAASVAKRNVRRSFLLGVVALLICSVLLNATTTTTTTTRTTDPPRLQWHGRAFALASIRFVSSSSRSFSPTVATVATGTAKGHIAAVPTANASPGGEVSNQAPESTGAGNTVDNAQATSTERAEHGTGAAGEGEEVAGAEGGDAGAEVVAAGGGAVSAVAAGAVVGIMGKSEAEKAEESNEDERGSEGGWEWMNRVRGGGTPTQQLQLTQCIGRSKTHKLPAHRNNGYLVVTANGGLNQMRAAICDMVAVARLMNATLLLPRLDHSSFWADPSEFGDIFDIERFITELQPDIRIARSLPAHLQSVQPPEIQPISWSNVSYYKQQLLPLLKKHQVLTFPLFDSRLANNQLPLSLQRLRCRVNQRALEHTEEIQAVARHVVERLRERGPRFIALHLRYEKDMLAFTGCTHGLSAGESEELRAMRMAVSRWKEKDIDGEARRTDGLCPLTPRETALFLRALGFGNDTVVYVAAGAVYGENGLQDLVSYFPNTVTHSSILSPSQLATLLPFQNRLAAVDHEVSVQSDAFVFTYDGNMARMVQGQRRFHGHTVTIDPDKSAIIQALDAYQSGNATWHEASKAIREAHGPDRLGMPRARRTGDNPKLEDYFFANPYPGCMCRQPQAANSY